MACTIELYPCETRKVKRLSQTPFCSVRIQNKTKHTKAKIFVENNGNGGENPEEFEIQEGLCVLWQQHWQEKLL